LKSCSSPLPELEGHLVERFVARQHVVGADDRGVAPDIAGADPALFQHRDVAQPEFLGEVVGCGEAMSAATDDDDIIFGLRLRLAPDRSPALVAGQPLAEDSQGGVAHGMTCPVGLLQMIMADPRLIYLS